MINTIKIKEIIREVLGLTDEQLEIITKKYSDDLSLLRVYSPLALLRYCESALPKTDKMIRTVFYLVVLESFAAVKQSNKNIKVGDFLVDNLQTDEKVTLLNGFLFSDIYEFKKASPFPLRHLMFKDFKGDKKFKARSYIDQEVEHCSTSEPSLCFCKKWLEQNATKIDGYLQELVNRFYQMRAAILHEAFPVLWLPDYEHDPNIAIFSATLVDAVPTGDTLNKFMSYESGIDPKVFYGIIKNCIKRFLLKTS